VTTRPDKRRGTPDSNSPGHLLVSGVRTDLVDEAEALARIKERFGAGHAPLGVASVNLDHVHHFGASGAWAGSLGTSGEWLNLIDGAPIAAKARSLTGIDWPRLAGSDLIGPILGLAERDGTRVGFLGGSEETRVALLETLGRERPGLKLAGVWSPSRAQITDPEASLELAATVRKQGVQLLVVCLGKPRQELWIEANAAATGSEVLLAFGAVADFIAGRVKRAPRWAVNSGMEWAWRLALEPKRLARRYLIQGPPAYVRTQRATFVPHESTWEGAQPPVQLLQLGHLSTNRKSGRPPGELLIKPGAEPREERRPHQSR
jgi:exopolysaccharide biosynthesis WecB/TagA/CpsF family protein